MQIHETVRPIDTEGAAAVGHGTTLTAVIGDQRVTILPSSITIGAVFEPLNVKLLRLARQIHADNIVAGWWTDIKTGESILKTRNRPEMMMLVVSELSEAVDGMEIADDKLPHLPGWQVELADAAIRLLDMLGAENVETFNLAEYENFDRMPMIHGSFIAIVMGLVNGISAAMEHYRKGRLLDYIEALSEVLLAIVITAEAKHFDLFDIIEQKRAYNRQRADHKIENRKAEGGKAF